MAGVVAFFFWPQPSEQIDSTLGRDNVSLAPPAPKTKQSPGELAEGEALPPAVKRYLEKTVYPPGTGRLTEAHQDLLYPNERYEDYRRILATYSENPGEVVAVRLTADHFFYTGDEIVRLDLSVKRGETLIAPISIVASARREGRAGPEGSRIPLRFYREGDGLIAKIDTAIFADHHGPIVVEARIEYDHSAFHREVLRFFFTPPGRIPARFTGDVQDRMLNGSLRVDIGLDVEQAGYYRIDANLYDRFGNPVSFSSFKGELGRGTRPVPVQFFGRVLREVGAAGPFTIGKIRGYRFLDGEYPDRERIPDLNGRFTTSAYDLDRFSEAEYTSEHKARMVELLLEDVAKGISIDAPPLPTGSPSVATDPG